MNLLSRLAKQEEEFFNSTFLSPVRKNSPVAVKINGIVFNMVVKSRKEGWLILRPSSAREAAYVREATRQETSDYLKLFPSCSIIITEQNDNRCGGILAFQDGRFSIEGIVPIYLSSDTSVFDIIDARFDGNNMWYESHNNRVSKPILNSLREAIALDVKPEQVVIPGLTPELKAAYSLVYIEKQKRATLTTEGRIKQSVERGGGRFFSYAQRGESYTITYSVDGHTHTSTVDKNLQVVSAGICLSGTDNRFDLQSLVSVVRQGQNSGRIYRVGNNR